VVCITVWRLFYGDTEIKEAVAHLRKRYDILQSQQDKLITKASETDKSIKQLMNKADKSEQDIADLNRKLEKMNTEMKKQFEIIESQFNDLMKELAQVDQRVTALELNVTSLDTRLTEVDQRTNVLESNVTSLNRRLTTMEKDSVAMAKMVAFFEISRLILEKFKNSWRAGEVNTDFFTLMGKTITFCSDFTIVLIWPKI